MSGTTAVHRSCIQCGGCCLTYPCNIARSKYNLTGGEKYAERCPALVFYDNKFHCLLIQNDTEIKHELLNGGCNHEDMRKPELLLTGGS